MDLNFGLIMNRKEGAHNKSTQSTLASAAGFNRYVF